MNFSAKRSAPKDSGTFQFEIAVARRVSRQRGLPATIKTLWLPMFYYP